MKKQFKFADCKRIAGELSALCCCRRTQQIRALLVCLLFVCLLRNHFSSRRALFAARRFVGKLRNCGTSALRVPRAAALRASFARAFRAKQKSREPNSTRQTQNAKHKTQTQKQKAQNCNSATHESRLQFRFVHRKCVKRNKPRQSNKEANNANSNLKPSKLNFEKRKQARQQTKLDSRATQSKPAQKQRSENCTSKRQLRKL